jgi:4-alpha-glucanotransferase
MDLKTRAARWGIETEYRDGFGRKRVVEPETLARLLDIFASGGESLSKSVPASRIRAYQGQNAASHPRLWALAVQLYGIKSRRNWGHGDFTDLKGLIELAARLGASGIGLNPLHALFDNRQEEFSPYSPSSRLFLNTHYIDPDNIPEFCGLAATGLKDRVAALREASLVDYAGVIVAKGKALALAYDRFRREGSERRKNEFTEFRQRGGRRLTRFSCFEFLRRRHAGPWWMWPEEWRTPDDERLAGLRVQEDAAIGYYEFLQWVADAQLRACRDRARSLGLPIGLYLDIAVGVRADGFDAWNEQSIVEQHVEIGAPPDPLNLEGQRWGIAGVNPIALAKADCKPFRSVLRASMQYAGAVRLDHVMALQRLYLIPAGMRGDQGAYVKFPFESMLSATAEESALNRCIVIGEDLGTVPENFRETVGQAGLWSYQVMLFQRAADGGFVAPDHYRENALVTFSTHDLPTFEGWKSGHDLTVKRRLGLDPGETAEERKAAQDAALRTMAWHGFPTLDYPNVIAFLAATPSRLLIVSAEDVLRVVEQVNVPGTVAEHPNWRRRLPVDLENMGEAPLLKSVAGILAAAGRGI